MDIEDYVGYIFNTLKWVFVSIFLIPLTLHMTGVAYNSLRISKIGTIKICKVENCNDVTRRFKGYWYKNKVVSVDCSTRTFERLKNEFDCKIGKEIQIYESDKLNTLIQFEGKATWKKLTLSHFAGFDQLSFISFFIYFLALVVYAIYFFIKQCIEVKIANFSSNLPLDLKIKIFIDLLSLVLLFVIVAILNFLVFRTSQNLEGNKILVNGALFTTVLLCWLFLPSVLLICYNRVKYFRAKNIRNIRAIISLALVLYSAYTVLNLFLTVINNEITFETYTDIFISFFRLLLGGTLPT